MNGGSATTSGVKAPPALRPEALAASPGQRQVRRVNSNICLLMERRAARFIDFQTARTQFAARCRGLAPSGYHRHPLRQAHGAVQDARARALVQTRVDGFVGSELHRKLAVVYPYSDASPALSSQGSPDWLYARSKRITASTVAKATGLLPAYASLMQCAPDQCHDCESPLDAKCH